LKNFTRNPIRSDLIFFRNKNVAMIFTNYIQGTIPSFLFYRDVITPKTITSLGLISSCSHKTDKLISARSVPT
jgi:hypothetical protein